MNSQRPEILGRKLALNQFLERSPSTEFEDGPVSDIYLPILSLLDDSTSVAGVLSAYLWWQGWFTGLLPLGKQKSRSGKNRYLVEIHLTQENEHRDERHLGGSWKHVRYFVHL